MMKLTYKQKEDIFIHSIFYLQKKIDKRIERLVEGYNKKMFGLRFFINIEYDNFLIDMAWYEDQLRAHISLAKQSGIKDGYSIEHAEYYLKRITDIGLKSIISAIRLKDAWFGLSKKRREYMNKELCEIAKEVMQEILSEKIN